MDSTQANSITPRDKERFVALSGPGPNGRPKARLLLRHYIMYSDGTDQELDSMVMEKPILSIFQHAGYVSVSMDFKRVIDQDLSMAWKILKNYDRPENSVSWLPEEIDSGYYLDENGDEKMVYFPMIDLTISPIGQETEYSMTGLNPVMYTLRPGSPTGEVTVLELIFSDEFFVVADTSSLNYDQIQAEAMSELPDAQGSA